MELAQALYCEIFNVPHKNTMRWKWRYLAPDGAMNECAEEYPLYFDCVAAARARGYEPRAGWTGPVQVALPPR